jgi:hypothetical protein
MYDFNQHTKPIVDIYGNNSESGKLCSNRIEEAEYIKKD